MFWGRDEILLPPLRLRVAETELRFQRNDISSPPLHTQVPLQVMSLCRAIDQDSYEEVITTWYEHNDADKDDNTDLTTHNFPVHYDSPNFVSPKHVSPKDVSPKVVSPRLFKTSVNWFVSPRG